MGLVSFLFATTALWFCWVTPHYSFSVNPFSIHRHAPSVPARKIRGNRISINDLVSPLSAVVGSEETSTPLKSSNGYKVPITLLAGFLGSGKTCTLKHLLENNTDGIKIGVVVNDVAAVNIDSKLVFGKTNGMVELQNGCVCCSLADELLTSIDALLVDQKQDLDAVVIELSGVADPMAIKSNWEMAKSNGHPVTKKAEISQVVTLVDASTFGTDWMSWDMVVHREEWATDDDDSRRKVSELLAEQVEAANVILINKQDLVEPDQVQLASEFLQTLNQDATIEVSEYGRITSRTLLPPEVLRNIESKQEQKESEVVSSTNDDDDDNMVIEDIDDMNLDELKALLLDLEGGEQEGSSLIPENATLDEARDIAWSHVMDSQHEEEDPTSTTSVDQLGITSFVYKANRPFHTKKIQALLSQWPVPIKDNLDDLWTEDGDPQVGIYSDFQGEHEANSSPFVGVLRSKGFCWFAPTHWKGYNEDSWRHTTAMYWSHAGRQFGVTAAGEWRATKKYTSNNDDECRKKLKEDFGDRRQEVVFIGLGIDQDKIRSSLDKCLLAEGEMEQYQREVSNIQNDSVESPLVSTTEKDSYNKFEDNVVELLDEIKSISSEKVSADVAEKGES